MFPIDDGVLRRRPDLRRCCGCPSVSPPRCCSRSASRGPRRCSGCGSRASALRRAGAADPVLRRPGPRRAVRGLAARSAPGCVFNPLTGLFESFRHVFLYGTRPRSGTSPTRPLVGLVLMRPLPPALPRASSATSRSWCAALTARARRGRRDPVPLRPPAADGQPDARPAAARAAARPGRCATCRSPSARARAWRCSARAARASRRCCARSPGVLEPDTGRIERRGRVGSLLSVQAGVMAMLTGRENTLLLGVLAGMTPDSGARADRGGQGGERPRRALRAPRRELLAGHARAARPGGDRAHGAGHPAARRDPRGARPRVPRPRRGLRPRPARPRRDRRRDRPRPPDARALLQPRAAARAGALVADGDFNDVQRHYLAGRRA